MSIIHDALKKVQQGLSSKKNKTAAAPLAAGPAAGYLYEKPADIETLSNPTLEIIDPKSTFKYKLRSFVIVIAALSIAIVCLFYIYDQFKNRIPNLQLATKKSLYKLNHKDELPDFKAKAPEDLKPMAQITINPPGTPSPVAAPPAPVTLKIHGIMSNATGNLVLINDQVYQEGDEVGRAKIVKIDLDSITIDIDGKQQKISVRN